MTELPKLLLVCGPTAVGKSSFAYDLAKEVGGELVSIDSVQLYRGLDIGTAKPSAADRAEVPHHLVDVLHPQTEHNVAEFMELAHEAIADIRSRGRVPIAVGGTNLYVRVLVHGIFDAPEPDEALRAEHREFAEREGRPALHDRLAKVDPELADRVHPNDLVRVSRGLEVWELTGKPLSVHQNEHAFRTPNYDALKLAFRRERDELYDRIDTRVDQMLERGLVQEWRDLVASGIPADARPMESLGYRHVGMIECGEVPFDEGIRLLKRDTRRFAKQQLSWLRSEEGVEWFELPDERDDARHRALEFLGR